MKIKLNNQEQEISDNSLELVSVLKNKGLYMDRGIAIAINDEILPKSEWEKHQIQENDNILIITATQGG